MGKLSAIFRIFKSVSPTKQLAKAIEAGKVPSVFAEDLKLVENVKVRDALADQFVRVGNYGSRLSTVNNFIDEIICKLNLCDDINVKTLSEKLLIGVKGESIDESMLALREVDILLDVVNTAKGKYCRLFDYENPFGLEKTHLNYLQKEIETYRAEGNFEKLEESMQRLESCYSEPRKKFSIDRRQGNWIYKSEMRNENKFSSLREFIESHPKDKETATYLWKKYFVKTQNTKIQQILNEIYDSYGVRVVTNDTTRFEHLYSLKREFEIYKQASNGKAKFPALFDIREDYLLMTKGDWAGYTNNVSKIVCPASQIQSTTPRHEIAHMQDNVCKREQVQVNDADKQELLNAGISKNHADYFFTNERESWAVFAQGDMSAYSEAFKQKMINLREGLPSWIVNLTPNDSYTTASRLKIKYSGEKYERMINEIEKVLGDEIPDYFENNKTEIKMLYKLCKKAQTGEKINIEEILTKYNKKRGKFGEYRFKAKHPNWREIYEQLGYVNIE